MCNHYHYSFFSMMRWIYVIIVMDTLASCGGGNQQVVCPMCGGTGVVEYIPGDVFAPQVQCSACNGTGRCDARTAQQVIDAQRQVNNMFGGGYQNQAQDDWVQAGNSGGYGYGGGNGRSIHQIEYDLRKAYEQLESLERDYRNCSSGVISAQYPQLIANQQNRIAQLEAELRNAHY